MYKKSILSIAIASSLMLTGCFENNKLDDENTGAQTTPPLSSTANRAFPVFSPAVGELPIPNDLLLQRDDKNTDEIEQSDGSYAIDGSDSPDATPPVVALENLSGASLTSPIDIEIGGLGSVDASLLDARSFVILGGKPTPNPAQNVFLIELEYASDAPLTALSAGEKPTATNGILALRATNNDPVAGQALVAMATTSPNYDAKVITRTKGDGSEATYIRINPLKPLNPNKRYIVVLTDEIKDTNGDSLIRNPGIASYAAISDANIPLANPDLAPVRKLINEFWQPVAEAYFTGLTNLARAPETHLSADNIVFSISLTTSNDTKVVDYMIEPNTWITDTIKSLVKGGAAKAATGAGATDYATTKATVDEAYNSWSAGSFSTALAGCDLAYADDNTADAATRKAVADDRFTCAGNGLEGYLTGTLNVKFPKPTADDTINFANHRDLRSVSAFISDDIAPVNSVYISEGTMSIPYYSGVPNLRGTVDGSEANLVNEWWRADETLANTLNSVFNLEALGSALPQGTPTPDSNKVKSDIVNSIFPFPKKNSDEEIPVLAIYPADDTNKPVDGYKTIIFQHGITTDRSAALTLGSAIVEQSGGTVAVLAIDQPLHGIDAISDEAKLDLAGKFLAGGQLAGLPASLAPSEANNQALVDQTLATTFVTLSLNGAGIIDASDGLDGTEQGLIAGAFNNTLAQSVVTGKLHASNVINIADGISPQEEFLIASAFNGTLTSTVITNQLDANNVIDTSDGISPQEQGIIDAVIAGATGNPGLEPFETAAASLKALELAATTTLPGLQTAAQALGLMQNTVDNGASQIPGLGKGSVNERHFGFAAVNLEPTPMDFNAGTVGTSSSDGGTNTGSGAMTINVKSFLTSRDNFRQHILDLMTLRLSIPTMDIDGINGPDLDGDDVHFIGHSLGTFNGIPFVEIANQTATDADNIKTANFLTPGGNIARLAENSEAFAPAILLGLNAAAGLNRGDADLETFLNVLQASLDSFDPINFVSNLSSTLSPTKALFTEIVGDDTIPNNAVPANDITNPYTNLSFGPGTDAPLAGTSPLETISGAASINATTPLAINFIRFADDSGAKHSTIVAPLEDSEDDAFAQIVEFSKSIVVDEEVTISNPGLIQP